MALPKYIPGKWLIRTLIIILIFKYSLKYLLGLNLQFNPFKCWALKVSYKDKFHLQSLKVYPFQRKIMITGLTIHDNNKTDTKRDYCEVNVLSNTTEENLPLQQESRIITLPKWFINYFTHISRAVNGFTLVFDDLKIAKENIQIQRLGLTTTLETVSNQFGVDVFVRKAHWHDQLLCGDGLFFFKTTISLTNETDIIVKETLGSDEGLDEAMSFPIQDTTLDIKLGDISLSMDIVNKMRKKANSDQIPKCKNIRSTMLTDAEVQRIVATFEEKIQRQCRTFLKPFSEINLAIDKIEISKIPVTPHEKLQEMNSFLSYHATVSNFSFNAVRFNNEMPGFKLVFHENDTPFKVSSTISRIVFSLDKREMKTKIRTLLKIMEIPNISVFGETNLPSQKFRHLSTSSSKSSSQSERGPIMNLKGNIASPTIDINIRSLSFLKSFLDNIKVFTQTFSDPMEVTNCVENCKISRRKQVMMEFYKTFLPIINGRLTLEDPKVAISDDQNNLIIFKFAAFMFNYQTKRYSLANVEKTEQIYFESTANIEILDIKLQHIVQDANYKVIIFKLESFALQSKFKLIPDNTCVLEGDIDTIHLDLSELRTMIMLNRFIRRLDCQMLLVEENYFKDLYTMFASNIETSEKECSLLSKSIKPSQKISLSDVLFIALPAYLDYLKITIRNIKMTLGARSVFMPPDVFSSVDSQSSHDLVDGKLRKFCTSIDKLQLAIFGTKTQWHNKISNGQIEMVRSGQNSEEFMSYGDNGLDDISTSEVTEVEHLWNVNLLFSSITSIIVAESAEVTDELAYRVVNKMSVLSVKVFPEVDSFSVDEPQKRITVQIENQKIKAILSLMNIFLIISGVHTLYQVFGHDIARRRRESWAKKYLIAIGNSKKKSTINNIDWTELKSLLQINYSSDFSSHVLVLPNGLKTKVESINTFTTIRNFSDVNISGELFRVLVESPEIQNIWSRFVSISSFSIRMSIDDVKDQMAKSFEDLQDAEPAVWLENESWHLSVPHKFEMYRLIDNVTTVVKSLKQMFYSLKTSKNDLIIFPKVQKAPSLPKIKLKSGRLLFSINDDPFEAQMNMICQIGTQEQRIRMEQWKEFDESTLKRIKERKPDVDVSDIHSVLYETNNTSIRSSIRRKSLERANQRTMPVPFNVDGLDEEDRSVQELVTEDIHRAFRNFQEYMSDSWIKRVNEYKRKEREEFKKNFSFLWGNINYSKFPSNVNDKVLSFTTYPFLMNLIVEDINIDVCKPSCGLEGIPSFIHEVGKGVPESMEYSIMIPMHLDCRFSEIRWHLRDYPMPFVYIPPLAISQSKSMPAIRIFGDFMVTENLVKSDEALRTLFVPLVPSIVMENSDAYYSLLVPRTVTSIKVYTTLQLDINSKDRTTVNMGNSYQPAIQQTMQCFDNFSKPPTDPSRKMGFWDKLRYMFHARIKISWKNNGRFEVGLKSARSPYMIGGKSAGFIIGFGENVILTCNETEDPKKFLSCTAGEIYFSIPNYLAKRLLVWSRPSSQTVFLPTQENTNVAKYASYYYLMDLLNTKNESAALHIMETAFIEKTGIKLTGRTTLNMGIVLERLSQDGKGRTFDAKKHYDVMLTNPIYVENLKTHDSYKGFRSEFIHMSFNLLSNSDSAYNSMQLSPTALATFFDWWKSFSGNFPVRRGPLYGMQSVSPKFGDHLYTISYHADVSPLYIAHIYHDIDAAYILKKNDFETVEFAGLKAKVGQFVMDLHQRKEVVTEYKKKLNVTKRVKKLKFLSADILTHRIDIRTVHGIFHKLNFIEEKAHAKYDIFDNDMSWLDISDFQEAFYIDVSNYVPNVDIRPLLFAPEFVYKKRANYGDKYQLNPKTYERIEPFNNGVSHDCIMGEHIEIPPSLIEKRLEVLEEFELKIKAKLRKSIDPTEKAKLTTFLNMTAQAKESVELLLADFNSVCPKTGKILTESGCFRYPSLQLLHNSKLRNKSFENRFLVFNMLLKWNEKVRDVVLRYLHFFNLTSDFHKLTSQHALETFDNILKQRLSQNQKSELESHGEPIERLNSKEQFRNAEDQSAINNALVELFETALSSLQCSIKSVRHENHYVQFITPQVQLMTKEENDSCVIISAPNVMMKVLAFEDERTEEINIDNDFLKRYGIIVTNANAFLFHKGDFKDNFELFFDVSSYGQSKNSKWPPWLGLELGFESKALQSQALIKNLSTVLFYEKVSEFSDVYELVKKAIDDKFSVFMPKLHMKMSSQNYVFLYKIVTNLFLYVDPEAVELQKQIEKLTIGYDLGNVEHTRELALSLFNNQRKLKLIEDEFLFKRFLLDDVGKVDLTNIHNERLNHLLRLYLIMNMLNISCSSKDGRERTMVFDINIKEILFHMLYDDNKPFIDIALAELHLLKGHSSYGFNRSQLTINMMQVFNLEKGVVFHDVFGPYIKDSKKSKLPNVSKDDPLISICWEMDKPVGGIKLINKVETKLAGLKINLEEDTLKRLITWLQLKETFLQDEDTDEVAAISDLLSNTALDSDLDLTEDLGADLNEMVKRASDYMTIQDLMLNSFKLCISYKGKGTRRLINISNFLFTFPSLSFENQMLRVVDILNSLKKLLIKVLIRHTGKFLKGKLKTNSKEPSVKHESRLKPLKTYGSYTHVDDHCFPKKR